MENKSPQVAKSILAKNTQGGGITILDFKLNYRATKIKTA
jgi:hypothetical protein